jgi:hypothetical protein
MTKLESLDNLIDRMTKLNTEMSQIRYGEELSMRDERINWVEYQNTKPRQIALTTFSRIKEDGALLRLDLTPISRDFNDLFEIIESPFNDRVAILDQLKTRQMPLQLSVDVLVRQSHPNNWTDEVFSGYIKINNYSLRLTSDCALSSDYNGESFEVHTIFPVGEEEIVFSNVDALRASNTSILIVRDSNY